MENIEDKNQNLLDKGPDELTPIGWVSDSQIESWKVEFKQKSIAEIETEDEEGMNHVAYFRKPTFELLQMVTNYDKKGESLKGLQTMFNTLFIGGSLEVKSDDEMKMSAMKQIGGLFKVKEAKLKKR